MPDAAAATPRVPQSPAPPLGRAEAEVLARTLRALADPTRLQILSMIRGSSDGRVMVKDLVGQLEFTQPTISHHLRVMFEEGLLNREKVGRSVYYSLSAESSVAVSDLLR